jgi:hypothetical protein
MMAFESACLPFLHLLTGVDVSGGSCKWWASAPGAVAIWNGVESTWAWLHRVTVFVLQACV